MQALFCGHVQRGRVGERAQHGALYSHMRYNGAYSLYNAFYMQGIKVYAYAIASRLQGFIGLLQRICCTISNQQVLFCVLLPRRAASYVQRVPVCRMCRRCARPGGCSAAAWLQYYLSHDFQNKKTTNMFIYIIKLLSQLLILLRVLSFLSFA